MIFYFLFLLFITSIIYAMEKRGKIVWPSIFLILFLISALRADGMGADFESYREVYSQINDGYKGYEILYSYLNIICSSLGGYRAVVTLVSCLSLVGVIYFTKHNSLKPSVSIWLYITLGFYTWTFTIYRQAVAISLILFAYEFARRKKPIQFILFILLATGFHSLSILMIVMYPMLNIKVVRKVWAFMSVFFLAFLLFFQKNILIIIRFVNELFGRRFAYYDLNQIESGGETLTLFYVFVFLIVALLTMQIGKKTKENTIDVMIFSSLTALCQVMAMSFPLTNRMGLFFAVPTFLLLPNVVENEFDNKSKQICYLFIMILSIVYFSILLYQESFSGSGIVPYRFVWQ